SIQKGQAVRFTLESLPRQNFRGVVETLRMIPVISSNVVSYTVIIKVDNQDGSLLPGMTCAVDFIVEENQDVLLVSNAALRFEPTSLSSEEISDIIFIAGLEGLSEAERKAAIDERAATAAAQAQNSGQSRNSGQTITQLMMGGGNTRGGPMMRQGPVQGGGRSQSTPMAIRNLWYVSDQGKLEAIRVETGISNGLVTSVFSAQDLEGKQFILREKINAGN
ncbi:MAG: hypothetical protein FWH35_07725, partial [Treponema sp.]|nr:hypothetical protein [Treponema sp.]